MAPKKTQTVHSKIYWLLIVIAVVLGGLGTIGIFLWIYNHATGSEVGVAAAARDLLQASGTPARVVSAPCLEWFAEQDEDYRARVLPEDAVVVSVEAGIAMGWREIVGARGAVVSLDHFGASAPGTRLFAEYGFTGEHVADVARRALARSRD